MKKEVGVGGRWRQSDTSEEMSTGSGASSLKFEGRPDLEC